jgi:hypothetical protein
VASPERQSVGPRHAWSNADVAMAATLVAIQLLYVVAMRATSKTDDGDPFDSTLYTWTWLTFPAIAAAASFLRPAPRVRCCGQWR